MLFTEQQIQFIRNENKNCEQAKRVTDKMLTFMLEHQLFKLIIPEALGGKMLDFPSAIRAFQEASYADSNFGWLVTIGSGGGMFTQNMTEQTARTFYSPENAVIAGSGFPAGTAQPVKDGYIINGKWLYCSGSQFATLFTVSCNVISETGDENHILAFALEPEQVDVEEDWNAFGLKGTSSNSIEIVNQFVPENHVFSIFESQNDLGTTIHTFPFVQYSEASFAAVSLGIGKHFLTEVESVLENNKQNWQQGSTNRFASLKQKLINEEQRWEKANQAFHSVVEEAWGEHIKGNKLSDKLKEQFSTISKRSAATAVFCANNLFRHVGMQAVMEHNNLNQIWRDLHTASQHAFLIPTNEQESLPFGE
ncbi:acyl-CoA dehydrogenase family protein [Radiobacillus sp. PE A8.2]|uniref:acyl-CoA dehydrogenase family protein n=1 Tax=Radiobacillus sp. PE A8.2 TaxID=3380349 RepID=UPI00388D2399